MRRDRAYYRDVRKRHIDRKKRIIHEQNDYWGYKYEGSLSKGKIHCSCSLCMAKTRNKGHRRQIPGNHAPNINYKPSEMRKIASLESQLNEDFEQDLICQKAETADVDIDAFVEDVYYEDIPLDGHYLEHQIDLIDFK